jgi:hypothetical protein
MNEYIDKNIDAINDLSCKIINFKKTLIILEKLIYKTEEEIIIQFGFNAFKVPIPKFLNNEIFINCLKDYFLNVIDKYNCELAKLLYRP